MNQQLVGFCRFTAFRFSCPVCVVSHLSLHQTVSSTLQAFRCSASEEYFLSQACSSRALRHETRHVLVAPVVDVPNPHLDTCERLRGPFSACFKSEQRKLHQPLQLIAFSVATARNLISAEESSSFLALLLYAALRGLLVYCWHGLETVCLVFHRRWSSNTGL